MAHYRLKKSTLRGELCAPPSKSQTLRAILFASLAKGTSQIESALNSPDTEAMLAACRSFGAKIQRTPECLTIQGVDGKIPFAKDVIDAGNSGIVLRFCTAVGSLAPLPVVVTGDRFLRYSRPMRVLLEALAQLGVSAQSLRGDGYAPVVVRGPIRGGQVVISGEDSQPVSALLIAAAMAPEPVEIKVLRAGEKPWIDLTLSWLNRLGVDYQRNHNDSYQFLGNARFEGFTYSVPGDLSSISFPVAAALITQSPLTLRNIDLSDLQGDKELLKVFQKMGAHIETEKDRVHVKKGGRLHGVSVDINPFIDAIAILAVVACFAEGKTRIYNGAVARQKECDRIRAMAMELRKMGARVKETDEGLLIEQSVLRGAALSSHGDHRVALSLAVAALGAEGESVISSVECVAKTYPKFVRDFRRVGANIWEGL